MTKTDSHRPFPRIVSMSDTTADIHEDEFNVMLSRPKSKFYPNADIHGNGFKRSLSK